MRCLAVLLLCSAALAAQASPRSIGGVVLAPDGSPAVGAEVVVRWRLHPELPGIHGWSLGGFGIAEAKLETDARGRFRFEAELEVPYAVLARHSEASGSQSFPVLPGDFVRIRLEPSFEFVGRVLDPDGAPVADCEVRLGLADASMWTRLGMYRLPQQERVVRSDPQGRFRLFYEHGYLRAPLWFPLPGILAEDGAGRCAGRPERLRPQRDSGEITLRLDPSPRRVVVVVVDDASGVPIAGAQVLDSGLPHRRSVTDAEGCVASPYLGGQLWVSAPGYTPVEAVPGAQVAGENRSEVRLSRCAKARIAQLDARFAGHRVLLAVESRQVDFGMPLELVGVVAADGAVELDQLPAHGPFHVWLEDGAEFVPLVSGEGSQAREHVDVLPPRHLVVRGQVLDAEGVPCGHARVALDAEGWPVNTTWTDTGGTFEIPGAPAAASKVIAVLDGRGLGAVDLLADKVGSAKVVLVLHRGKVIEGSVDAPDGKPLAGAWISVSSGSSVVSRDLPPGPSSSHLAQVVFTDGDGHFRFESLSGTAAMIDVAAIKDGVRLRATANVTLPDGEPLAPLRIRTEFATRD